MKRLSLLIFLFLGLFSHIVVFSQEAYQQLYNTDHFSSGYVVQTTDDGGVLLAGRHDLSISYSPSLLLIKTNSFGDTLWTNRYQGAILGEVAMIESNSGGFLVATSTANWNILLLRLDDLGDTLWTKAYDLGFEFDVPTSIIECDNGEFLITGHTAFTLFMLRIDTAGVPLWSKKYKGSTGGSANAYYIKCTAKETSDHGFIVVSTTVNSTNTDSNGMILKTDSVGILEWTRSVIGINEEGLRDVIIGSDSYYYAVGYTTSFSADDDMFLVKLDTTGNLVWAKTYSSDLTGANAMGILERANGEFVIFGEVGDYFGPAKYPSLIKIDTSGSILYSKSMSGSGFLRDIDVGLDNRMIMTGSYFDTIANSYSVLLKKMFSDDGISCFLQDHPFTEQTVNLTELTEYVEVTAYSLTTGYDAVTLIPSEIYPVLQCKKFEDTKQYEQLELTSYPNPVKDHFYLSVPDTNMEYELKLYDITGKLLLRLESISHLNNLIYIENFSSGTYYYTLKDDKNGFGTGKIIVE